MPVQPPFPPPPPLLPFLGPGVQERRLLPGEPRVDAGGARGAACHAGQPERPGRGGHRSGARPAHQAGRAGSGLALCVQSRPRRAQPFLLGCALPFFVTVAPPLPADPQSSGPALPPPPLQVQAAIDSAPHLSLDAQRLGLIDARLYRDQAVKLLGRLQEARQPVAGTPATNPAASSKAGAPGAPEGLLPRLLAKPDAGLCRRGRGAPGMRGGLTKDGLACPRCTSVRACLSLVGRPPACAALFPRLPFPARPNRLCCQPHCCLPPSCLALPCRASPTAEACQHSAVHAGLGRAAAARRGG